MGIELDIKITSPLSPDDRDLLAGISVMVLAVANRNLAQEAFPRSSLPTRRRPRGRPSPTSPGPATPSTPRTSRRAASASSATEAGTATRSRWT